MRVIIAGTRTINDMALIDRAVSKSGFEVDHIVHGGARGVDTMAARWARLRDIPTSVYLPDWFGKGNAAGPLRNIEMCKVADALIAVWDGKSRGTANMIREAMARGLRTHVEQVDV